MRGAHRRRRRGPAPPHAVGAARTAAGAGSGSVERHAVFIDAGARDSLQPQHWDRVTEWVRVGGLIVFDDLKPLELWPPEWNDLVDRKREFAFHNPRVESAEVRTTATEAALVITRVR